MNTKNKILNLIGLASRARKIVAGEDLLYKRISKVEIIFLASDVGPSTYKKVTNKAHFYKIEVDQTFTRDELSKAIGKSNRVVVGVTDNGFATSIKKLLEEVK